MFDFENLEVYKKAKRFNESIHSFILRHKLDRTTKDQLRRASFSIMLNIAEGSGRSTKPDKKNFYTISRGSVFECVAILDFLKGINIIQEEEYKQYYAFLEEISKMLYSMIQTLKK